MLGKYIQARKMNLKRGHQQYVGLVVRDIIYVEADFKENTFVRNVTDADPREVLANFRRPKLSLSQPRLSFSLE